MEYNKNTYIDELDCKLDTIYKFMAHDKNTYEETKANVVNVAGIEIGLDKRTENAIKFNQAIGAASEKCIDVINTCVNKVSGRSVDLSILGDLEDELLEEANDFGIDCLKYSYNKLKLSNSVTEQLIKLVTENRESLKQTMDDATTEYYHKSKEAKEKSESKRTLYQAESANALREKDTGVMTTVNISKNWFDDGYTARGYSTTYGPNPYITPVGSYSAASARVELDYKVLMKDADKKVVLDLRRSVDKVQGKFIVEFLKIIFDNNEQVFNKNAFIKNATNPGDNPYRKDNWLNIIEKMLDTDFAGFKQASEYYKIDLKQDILDIIVKNAKEDYLQNGKCDYESVYTKLYVFLGGTREEYTAKIKEAIIEHYENEIKNIVEEKKSLDGEAYNNIIEKVKKCSYLDEKDIAKVDKHAKEVLKGKTDAINKERKDKEKEYNKPITNGITSIIITLVLLALCAVFVAYVIISRTGIVVPIVIVGYIGMYYSFRLIFTKCVLDISNLIKVAVFKRKPKSLELDEGAKNKVNMILICLFFGIFGVHKFKEYDYVKGILYLFTLGFFGVGMLSDLYKLITTPKEYF